MHLMNPEPTPRLVFLWNEAWLWLHWILMFEETATKATVPRKLTAFEDYCGRWRYLKQALVASKGWETLPISLPTWPLAWPAPTAIPKCPHFWTVVPLSPQLLLKKKQCLSNPGWYHYQVAQGLATFPHLKRELFRSFDRKRNDIAHLHSLVDRPCDNIGLWPVYSK